MKTFRIHGFHFLIALLILNIFFTSCASTPRRTVFAWIDAMYDFDFERAKDFCTPRCNYDQLRFVQYAYEIVPPTEAEHIDLTKWDWAYWRSHFELEMNGDTARAWETGYEDEVLELVKIDGVWYIDNIDIDWGVDFEEIKPLLEREALQGF
jgi:hypothetical protein